MPCFINNTRYFMNCQTIYLINNIILWAILMHFTCIKAFVFLMTA